MQPPPEHHGSLKHRHFVDSVRLSVALMIWLSGTRLLFSQDRVTFIPEGASSPVTMVGEVIDSNGRELLLRTINGTKSISAQRIQGIQTAYDPAHLRGIEEFEQGDLSTARISFQEALKREHRGWVQREIRAWLVKCDLRDGNLLGALREFQAIVLDDPQTRHWSIAPLVWAPVSINASVREEMQRWLKSTREPERLLAASILLLDPILGEQAERQLDDLARSTNPVISSFSRAQLWRLEIARREVSDLELNNWRENINRLPPERRSGPQYLLARGHEIRGELRQAAAEALWLPYVYAENEQLSARALLDASQALERTGLTTEASTLERELLQRFPWSNEASQIRSKLRQPGFAQPRSERMPEEQ